MGDESTFGALLKRYRRSAHLSQADLADRAGYSSHYVSMLERGLRRAQPLTVDMLSDALAIQSGDRAALHAAAMQRASVPSTTWHVAPPALPLLGREREIVQLTGLLHDEGVRLLTLTGLGGVGKTTLAREVATAVAESFPDGAVFVDMAAVNDPDDILPTIARALTLRTMRGQSLHDRIAAFLRERRVLLLLDSMERVLAWSNVIGDLLDACPGAALLITSRAPLRLQAEREIRIRPLALPAPGCAQPASEVMQSPAVALFIRRASLVNPALTLDDERVAIIAEICRQLDGLPLAIELAAARVSHLPLAALRDRLRHRMTVLTGGPRDLPIRHQRLRDTIAWSEDLLAYRERVLLRRLAVFAGSWSLEGAEAVCTPERPDDDPLTRTDVLDGLRALVESSLIITADDGSDEPRFRMLDTIREYAAEQLAAAGEQDALEQRHAGYYVHLAEVAEPALQDRNQRTWYPRLEHEQENVRAAVQWLLSQGDAEAALRLTGAVWRYWQRHGDVREGRRLLEATLAVGSQAPEHVRAKALWGASWLAYQQGDYERSAALSAEHLMLARIQDDALSLRNALTGVGMAALAEGRIREATEALREALDTCLPLGKIWHRATSYLNVGNAMLLAGDLAAAAELFAQSLELYLERGDEVFAARARQHLGYVALLRGDHASAAALLGQSVRALADLGEQPGIADGLEAAAALCAATGRPREAVRLVAAATVLRERIGLAPLAYLHAIWQPLVARAELALDATARATAWEEGHILALPDAVASAVAACG